VNDNRYLLLLLVTVERELSSLLSAAWADRSAKNNRGKHQYSKLDSMEKKAIVIANIAMLMRFR